MPYESTTYRRDDLYRQVWARPMREVAKEYGVSDVALANACRKLNVPRPSRGYWTRKAAGHDVRPVPLPPLKPNEPSEYKVSRWKDSPPPPLPPEELAFRARPEFQPEHVDVPFTTTVSPTLERPHRLVAATLKGLSKAKPDRDGLCIPRVDSGLPVKISHAQTDRAMRFLDALLKAVEKAGHQVRPAEGYQKPARFLVEGAEVEFSLKERLVRIPHVPRPDDLWSRISQPKWDYQPGGRLRFKIEYDKPYIAGQEWEDSSSQPLEARVNEVFRSILEAAPYTKARAAERKERARLQAEEDRRRWELEVRRREEQREAETLVEQAQQWQRSQLLRQFVEAVRAEAVARYGEIEPESSADAWLKRVSAVAERLDPIPALFGPPETK